MKLSIILLLLFITISSTLASTCNIFIHGYTRSGYKYFNDLPRQVLWESSQSIEKSAVEVAQGCFS